LTKLSIKLGVLLLLGHGVYPFCESHSIVIWYRYVISELWTFFFCRRAVNCSKSYFL